MKALGYTNTVRHHVSLSCVQCLEESTEPSLLILHMAARLAELVFPRLSPLVSWVRILPGALGEYAFQSLPNCVGFPLTSGVLGSIHAQCTMWSGFPVPT